MATTFFFFTYISLPFTFYHRIHAGSILSESHARFVPEQELQEAVTITPSDSLQNLLAMPHSPLSNRLKRASLDLKETIVVEMWGLSGQRVGDFTLYCGLLGIAFLLFKSHQVSDNTNDLTLCVHIIKSCDATSVRSIGSPSQFTILLADVTFICGRDGVCALGAVAAKHIGDDESLRYYLAQFQKIKRPKDLPDELLYGRVGFLWACLFLSKHLGQGTIPSSYTWYAEKYWGAAHVLAGIMHVLMDMELKPDELEDVRETLKYMIHNNFPSGNYPASEEDKKRDVLVHWCHGAPRVALTLVKAAKVKTCLMNSVDIMFFL
ncbi:hypothetical protein KIW84_074978 [Lathyrus oleraceus]|uniref:CRIB domain-containing protein n=1 Tax=Pisum sativum TaxID=3888 RepID=A0A9D4VSL1_PEA|nr:hypothetical protein KIW84_074978 [Pisum sativum]